MTASLLTRLAIESYYQPKLSANNIYRCSYSAVFRTTKLLLDLPDIEECTRSIKPASFCFCMHCGNVIPLTGLMTQSFFQQCCERCHSELTPREVALILTRKHGNLSGWNAIESLLVMNESLLLSYNHYLQNLWLTGTNPFEIIIEQYKTRLSNERLY